jgi:hypothetical protein
LVSKKSSALIAASEVSKGMMSSDALFTRAWSYSTATLRSRVFFMTSE